MTNKPTVSICCITYNHEKFIGDAIDSFLMQKTNFPIEIIIGEDYSKDLTRSIVENYANKYPELIKVILPEKNLGAKQNFVATMIACRGKYIALCEGDDYWTDPYKLQKQVDFLENNPDYVLISHNAINIREKENYSKARLVKTFTSAFDITTRDLMISNPCVTLTVMFKNGLIVEYPPIYYESTGGDRRLFLLLSQFGKGHVTPDVVGVYRTHSTSITNSRNTPELRLAAQLESIRNAKNWNKFFDHRYDQEVQLIQSKMSKNIVTSMIQQKRFLQAVRYSLLIEPDDITSRRARRYLILLQFIGKILGLKKPII